MRRMATATKRAGRKRVDRYAVGSLSPHARPLRPGFGRRLRSRRTAAGLSTAALAAAIGASQSTVVRYESGAFRPTAARLDAIAAVLGVPVADLDRGDR